MIVRNFISLFGHLLFTWKTHYCLNFDFGQIDWSQICTEVWSHVSYNKKVSLHQSEILPQNEISNWFEFTLGLM